MKFSNITAASFLAFAASAVAADAYEVPSGNHIKELAEAYNVEKTFLEEADKSSSIGLRGASFDDKQTNEMSYQEAAEEACKRCKFWKKVMDKETSGPEKKNALRRYLQAKAATLRAEAHLFPEAEAAWEEFKEEHGASAAQRMADKWMKRHDESKMYDEKSRLLTSEGAFLRVGLRCTLK